MINLILNTKQKFKCTITFALMISYLVIICRFLYYQIFEIVNLTILSLVTDRKISLQVIFFSWTIKFVFDRTSFDKLARVISGPIWNRRP